MDEEAEMTKDEARQYLKEWVKKNGPAKRLAYEYGKTQNSVYQGIRDVSGWLPKVAGIQVKRKVTRVVETTYEAQA